MDNVDDYLNQDIITHYGRALTMKQLLEQEQQVQIHTPIKKKKVKKNCNFSINYSPAL